MKSFLVSIFFVAILIASLYLFTADFSSEIKKTTISLQIVLFWGLVFYSTETYFLRKTTERSMLFEQRPCLVPYIRHINDGSYHIKIRNVGRGTALDVSIKIIDPKGDYKGILKDNVKYIPTGDEKSIQFFGSKVDPADPERFNKTNLCNQPEGFKVVIKCKDASNGSMSFFKYEINPERDANWDIRTENIGLN
jgi:hypothetical protein